MKNLLFFLSALFITVSCSNDDGGNNPQDESNYIDTKWIISSNDDYESIEFCANGIYIVTYKQSQVSMSTPTQSERFLSTQSLSTRSSDPTVTFGTYTIQDDDSIVMSDFGTVLIESSDDTNVSFSLILEDNTSVSITSTVAETITYSSSNTDLLCSKIWEYISSTENGVNVELDIDQKDTTFNFTKSGTYLITYYDGSYSLFEWKWKDESKGEFYYKNYNGWDGSYATILELSSSKLVVKEIFYEGGTNEEICIDTLKAVN